MLEVKLFDLLYRGRLCLEKSLPTSEETNPIVLKGIGHARSSKSLDACFDHPQIDALEYFGWKPMKQMKRHHRLLPIKWMLSSFCSSEATVPIFFLGARCEGACGVVQTLHTADPRIDLLYQLVSLVL